MNNKIIGSHVSFKSKDYLIGSVNETLSYNANCFMIYTGPPQNFIRKEIDDENVAQAHKKMKENNINANNCIVHAPYVINLASSKETTRNIAVDFLVTELNRTEKLKFKFLVLHPGSSLEQSKEEGLNHIVNGLNRVFSINKNNVTILLETMSGKGSEVGNCFQDLKFIIENVKDKRLGICLDTCHLHDAGYDLSNIDLFLEEYEKYLDFKYIKAIHLNDSKNELGSKKDRHENIGYGKIGYETIQKWVNYKRFEKIPKILETPYYEDLENKCIAPYKNEIEILNNEKWFNFKK